MKNGHFVISLDFELHWGLFDIMDVEEYEENLKNVNKVIQRLLELSNKYNVKLTFATVGFLFAKNKKELLKFKPRQEPTYTKEELNPYPLFDTIGDDENDDPFHFGNNLLKQILANKNHEIGTHTFSHYYCNEAGQTIAQFEADINAAIEIGNAFGVEISSIVFPRNMVNNEALNVCVSNNITSYRGTEKASVYRIDPKKAYYNWLLIRGIRLLDSYINITGDNIYNVEEINKNSTITNLPSSRFLRPYSTTLSFLEPLKLKRIIKGMRKAAKQNKLYHLWWHPHNFGTNMDENFSNLEKIFIEYEKLHKAYNFSSETMTSLSKKVMSVTS